MKKNLIIGIVTVVIILLASVWAYLLLFGVPEESRDLFSNYDFGGLSSGESTVFLTGEPDTLVETNGEQLDQLTTRPVAGYRYLEDEVNKELIYAERGTGHIFLIDLNTGQESRLSAGTFQGTNEALFSPTGDNAVLIKETSDVTQARLVIVDKTARDQTELPSAELSPNAESLNLLGDGLVNYLLPTSDGARGYQYDYVTGENDELFSVPFRDVTVIWGDENTYIYNKPAPDLRGGLYEVASDGLSQIVAPEYGLVAGMLSEDYLAVSYFNEAEGLYETYMLSSELGGSVAVAITILPEKCAQVRQYQIELWCATPYENKFRQYISEWYKGVVVETDVLWQVNLIDQAAVETLNFVETAGFSIDAANLQLSDDGSRLFFINRLNGNLWRYNTN